MESDPRIIDVYWTVRGGERFTVSLSEEAAWDLLKGFWAFADNPNGWSVERTTESVPHVIGEVVEGGGGEAVELDDDGRELSRMSYVPVKIFWKCPHCGDQHSTDRYDHPVDRTSPAPNPSIWFCEVGRGIVLVRW